MSNAEALNQAPHLVLHTYLNLVVINPIHNRIICGSDAPFSDSVL